MIDDELANHLRIILETLSDDAVLPVDAAEQLLIVFLEESLVFRFQLAECLEDVTNAAIASALQDVSGYVVAPMANTLSQTSDSLYHAGTLGGLQVYVDPYMAWDDTRICVGRKGGPKEPGLVFMPYILADQVQIVAEGTMAQKMLVNSRFALVPIGFWPEASYYTFCVYSDSGLI